MASGGARPCCPSQVLENGVSTKLGKVICWDTAEVRGWQMPRHRVKAGYRQSRVPGDNAPAAGLSVRYCQRPPRAGPCTPLPPVRGRAQCRPDPQNRVAKEGGRSGPAALRLRPPGQGPAASVPCRVLVLWASRLLLGDLAVVAGAVLGRALRRPDGLGTLEAAALAAASGAAGQ